MIDLLDDWSRHYAFSSVRREVENAYAEAFSRSEVVFANSEDTLALAHRFGRSDARLMLNGVDSDLFRGTSAASGPLTVGYVGKIGTRVDLELVRQVCEQMPTVNFVFAGPILDRGYRAQLSRLSNVELLGDVHYSKVPELLQTFDVGWVPHRTGKFEVGGDVLKTYEYRAAGLPVLTTPVLGAGLNHDSGVYVVEPAGHRSWIAARATESSRVPREPSNIPASFSWRSKARAVAGALGTDLLIGEL